MNDRYDRKDPIDRCILAANSPNFEKTWYRSLKITGLSAQVAGIAMCGYGLLSYNGEIMLTGVASTLTGTILNRDAANQLAQQKTSSEFPEY